ncbi:MAG: crossover junction endodeoxyribonuclease RuvC [Deltaproteobacteria bacterium]|nr:crossover junction endodeoxyribonuclease RuvC [Deltaproteobacteria bacterium]
MLILGIDPGSRITGWGLLEANGRQASYCDSGEIRLSADSPLENRLVVLGRRLEELLDRHSPQQCAVEKIFTARNARSALVLGHARGVILHAVARREIPIFEYAPTQIKQAVTGVGRATKDQITQMTALLLSLRKPFGEDESDALAAALTHAAAARLRSLS